MDRPWLADVAVIPEDGSTPRVMSPAHPDAVGSYGADAERWATDELGIELRWWQRLALRRMLEHDDAGELVWRQVIVSTPRRAGKSVLMMVVACWRLTHGGLLGSPRQTVLHTGQDLQVVGEVMRLAWPWAQRHEHLIRRKNGQESIEVAESRWLMRSQNAVFGYEVDLGLVDECWSVPAQVVDDGLEPAALHRRSPMLVLCSTAHRRATSLMRRRLEAALTGLGEDWSTLLLWWAAPEGEPVGDPSTWRAASPYWTEQQQELISSRWERALRGEADPQADDPDAMEGFKAQYLNLWPPPHAGPPVREHPAVPVELWENQMVEPPTGRPAAAGMEAYFGAGYSVALAFPIDGDGTVVTSMEAATAAAAVDLVLASGALRLGIGKSLAEDPALRDMGPVQVMPQSGMARALVSELRRLLDENRVFHDGAGPLDDQVRPLMVTESTDGPRLKYGSRTDAIKAAVWAVQLAAQPLEIPRIW